jgi:hypothetical protein
MRTISFILILLIFRNLSLCGGFANLGGDTLNSDDKRIVAISSGLSLILPGLGQAYIGRFDVGRYFVASELTLWVAYLGMILYGRWLNEDAINFAVIHAGIDKAGKPDDFFVNIENFRNVYDYNDKKMRDRDYDLVYDPEKFFWWWDSDEARRRYKDMRKRSRAFKYYANFILAFVVVNHIVSAIDAGILARRLNRKIHMGIQPIPSGVLLSIKFKF